MSAIVEYLQYLYNIPHNFRTDTGRKFLDAYPDFPPVTVVCYFLVVFYLPGYLKRHKKVYEMKFLVAFWNLALSLISTIGAYYADILVYDLVFHDRGFHKTCCEVLQLPDGTQFGVNIKDLSHRGAQRAAERQSVSAGNNGHTEIANRGSSGTTAFYVTLFMYLKMPELFDTLFLILQGKPVSFLHWFHHILTAIYCWHASYALIPAGLFFVAMNYTVHSIMYFYFFLVVMGLRNKIRWFAPVITLMQVTQMFFGMYITCYTYLQYWLGPTHKGELFYGFFNLIFSTFHYARVQIGSLVTTGTILSNQQVPAYDMAARFKGCQTDATNLRMGIMMYGAYCVLFYTLLVELYFSKGSKKNSLVVVRKEKSEEGHEDEEMMVESENGNSDTSTAASEAALEDGKNSPSKQKNGIRKNIKNASSSVVEDIDSNTHTEERRKTCG